MSYRPKDRKPCSPGSTLVDSKDTKSRYETMAKWHGRQDKPKCKMKHREKKYIKEITGKHEGLASN